MTILDKLIEKKDIHCYIKARKAHLVATARKEILAQEPRRRELIKKKIAGRIEELNRLDALLHRNEVERDAIRSWPYVYAGKGRAKKGA